MLINIKTVENGWETERTMELPDNEKLLGSLLRTVKKFTEPPVKRKAKEAAIQEAQTDGPEAPQAETEPPVDVPEVKKPPIERTVFERPKYRGFLLIRCKGCWNVYATCVKYPAVADYTCRNCGHVTQLEDMVPAELHCGTCGKTWTYTTNVVDADVVCRCVGCGDELHGWWDAKKRKYLTR